MEPFGNRHPVCSVLPEIFSSNFHLGKLNQTCSKGGVLSARSPGRTKAELQTGRIKPWSILQSASRKAVADDLATTLMGTPQVVSRATAAGAGAAAVVILGCEQVYESFSLWGYFVLSYAVRVSWAIYDQPQRGLTAWLNATSPITVGFILQILKSLRFCFFHHA